MSRPTHCLSCGQPLTQQKRGRPRLYCSSACRAKAYRQRCQRRSPVAATDAHKVRVLYSPTGLFTHGEFTWTDFKASLGVWPEGLQVQYRGSTYAVQGDHLVEVAESERADY